MASCNMIYTQSFMELGVGVQEKWSSSSRNSKGCNVGITDGKDLSITPLRWDHAKFHNDWFRNSEIAGGGTQR
jgi:hypothetical protein